MYDIAKKISGKATGVELFEDDRRFTSDNELQFRDTGVYIKSGADGKLTISADGTGLDDITLSGSVTLTDKMVAGASGDAAGIALTTAQPRGIAYYAELPSAGTALTAGTVSRGIYCRYLVNKDQDADVSLYAAQGHLRLKADLVNGMNAGVSGYVEQSGTVATSTAGYLIGGHFAVETDNSFTLGAGTSAGGILIQSRMVGGTITGTAAAIISDTADGATAFPNFIAFDAADGTMVTTASSATLTSTHKIAVKVGADVRYMLVGTVS